jgi:hypothetical protein
MIIDHLICDSRTLLACSLTCYSWYIVVAPHIHHTLVTKTHSWDADTDLKWPKPLRNMHIIGLLPLVKKFHIRGASIYIIPIFSPKLLGWCTLFHFTALTNVQELGIDYLDIPSFIPRIRWYFGHFSLTVRSLALREPKGSRRQIIYFIGMFKHLEDLKLIYDKVNSKGEPAEDPILVPPFIPPLRGRLTAARLPRAGIWKDMIELFGGIRFRYMDLFNVAGTRLLLDACAETLETLRLYPSDPRGKELSLDGPRMRTDDLAAVSSIRDFDLSRNKFLRTLEVTGRSIDCGSSSKTTTRLLIYALSTIISPAFSEVTVIYRDSIFRGVSLPSSRRPVFWSLSLAEIAQEASWFDQQFEVFQAMHRVRDFQLVFYADVWERVGEYTMGVLKQAVAAEKVKRRFDDTYREPLVIYSPRASRLQKLEYSTPGSYLFDDPWIPL